MCSPLQRSSRRRVAFSELGPKEAFHTPVAAAPKQSRAVLTPALLQCAVSDSYVLTTASCEAVGKVGLEKALPRSLRHRLVVACARRDERRQACD